MVKMDLPLKISTLNKELELNNNLICIVEGINDKKVLAKLGFKNVLDISGKRLYDVAQHATKHFQSAVILSDFDDEGEAIADYLKKNLQAKGIYVNSRLRDKFRSLFGVQKIEELNSLADFKAMYDSGSGALVSKEINRKRFSAKQKARSS